jgi:hypothetical protein
MNKIIYSSLVFIISTPVFANVLENEWVVINGYPTVITFWHMVLLCFWWLFALSLSLIFLAILYSVIFVTIKIANRN